MTFAFANISLGFSICLFSLLFCTLTYCANEINGVKGSFPIRYARSPSYLQYLENVESRFYEFLKNKFLKEIKGKKQKNVKKSLKDRAPSKIDAELEGVIKSFMQDYEENVLEFKNSNEFLTDHPILTLQMLSRFVKYSSMINNRNIFMNVPNNIIKKEALPNGTEIIDAAAAFFRIQYVYDLHAHQMANGTFGDIHTNVEIKLGACLEFAQFAQANNYFALAIQWYEVALKQLKEKVVADMDDEFEVARIEEAILKAIKDTIETHNRDLRSQQVQHGNLYQHLHGFSEPLQAYTNYSNIAHLTQRNRLVEDFAGMKILDQTDPRFNASLEGNMLALCSGSNFQSEEVKANLKCFMGNFLHPYWRINPLKIEVLNEYPLLVQFYDIIGDETAATAKKLAFFEVDRALSSPEAPINTAAMTWIPDESIPSHRLSEKIEFITGLHVVGKVTDSHTQPLQVAGYTVGSHMMTTHYDSYPLVGTKPYADSNSSDAHDDLEMGYRLNTFLVYLNSVVSGGRTAFPMLGLASEPVKNSAVMWYNNLRNGQQNDLFLHVACPVLQGHKWIITKWTRINRNIFNYPCGLTPEE